MDSETEEYQESNTVVLEWTLRGLGKLFDSSKGEVKSKAIKSVKFCGGRWQLLFYANAGAAEGSYMSVYLSCEPTTEEKDRALDGKWVREGSFKFNFELRNVGKTVVYHVKEAHPHVFSHKDANWGWAQFAKRDQVYYNSPQARRQDTFVIICTITSSPSVPPPSPVLPRQSVPRDLLQTVGSLLDDPIYSDVEFVIPSQGESSKKTRKIWAAKSLLARVDYFKSMFGSGFSETSHRPSSELSGQVTFGSAADGDRLGSESLTNFFEDSDDEDYTALVDENDGPDSDMEYEPVSTAPETATNLTVEPTDSASSAVLTPAFESDSFMTPSTSPARKNARMTPLSSPSSALHLDPGRRSTTPDASIPGPLKVSVVVKDVAYVTYRALLYYIYTDSIVFAPLSSTFVSSQKRAQSIAAIESAGTRSDGQGAAAGKQITHNAISNSRKEWIFEWMQNNPGRPSPCSAKSAYRLADKLDLHDLKERAARHIFNSLNIHNISYEVFSPFSAAFEDIRRFEVNFFLEHWTDVRISDAMRNVWQQIRNGRHPGFEEVWPVIAQNLEFKPLTVPAGSADASAGDF